jgi:hypothetical protein
MAVVVTVVGVSGSVRSLGDRVRPTARVVEAADGAAAVRAARRQHTPVVVANLTTGTRQIQALPDGTMRATLSVVPVRVRRATGWVPVDTTLIRRPDGSVAPRATTVPLALSGGGSAQPLVQLGQPGRRMALSWPGALPVPVLSGDTATYRQVLPGVDLLIRAQTAGYSERLVIRDAAAARNPALAALRYGLAVDGLSVRAGGDGSLSMVDHSGAAVFT